MSKAIFADHESSNGSHEAHPPGHLAHCVSYLMQAILCASDTSLEKADLEKLPDGETATSVTGLDTIHTCRNHQRLFDFTARYTVALSERDYSFHL